MVFQVGTLVLLGCSYDNLGGSSIWLCSYGIMIFQGVSRVLLRHCYEIPVGC